MHNYIAYGLRIHSALPLPQFVPVEADAAEVVIRLKRLDCFKPALTSAEERVYETSGGVYLFWKDVGGFLVRGGSEVLVDPAPGVYEQILPLAIGGPIFATLLRQRGLLVLHGSAVSVNSNVVVFLGGQRSGKSTLAATLYTRGHSVVSDDVTAVRIDGGNLMVFPSFPQLKLWPDAVAFLKASPERLLRLYPQFEKRAYPAARGFAEAPVPLKRIYVLANGTHIEIEALQPQEAFVELVRHTYGAHMGILECTGVASSHFRQCARLASSVLTCRLEKQDSLSTLAKQAQLVEEDLAMNNHYYTKQLQQEPNV